MESAQRKESVNAMKDGMEIIAQNEFWCHTLAMSLPHSFQEWVEIGPLALLPFKFMISVFL